MSFLGMFSFILPNFCRTDAGVLQGHREIGEVSSGKTQVTFPDTPQLQDLSQVYNTLTYRFLSNEMKVIILMKGVTITEILSSNKCFIIKHLLSTYY